MPNQSLHCCFETFDFFGLLFYGLLEPGNELGLIFEGLTHLVKTSFVGGEKGFKSFVYNGLESDLRVGLSFCRFCVGFSPSEQMPDEGG